VSVAVGAGWLAARCRPWQADKSLPTRHAWSQRRPGRLVQLAASVQAGLAATAARCLPLPIPCKYRGVRRSLHPAKYLKRKKKRGKTLNCSIIKWLTFGVPFLR